METPAFLPQLRTLEAKIVEELKKLHFLGASQAQEQILNIAWSTDFSVKELLAGKRPKKPKSEAREAKFGYPDDSTKRWNACGRQPRWVKGGTGLPLAKAWTARRCLSSKDCTARGRASR